MNRVFLVKDNWFQGLHQKTIQVVKRAVLVKKVKKNLKN